MPQFHVTSPFSAARYLNLTTNMNGSVQTNFISAAKGIACSTSSLVGPTKCIKCIIDEDDNFELTSSVLKLLQIIKVEHPAISIIHDICKGFHKAYGTCCTTLVFMMGSWLQSMEFLLDQGLPLLIINHLLKEAVDICTEEAHRLSIPVNELPQAFNECETMSENSQENFTGKEKPVLSSIEMDRSKTATSTSPGSKYTTSNLSNKFSNHRKIAHGNVIKFSSKYSRHFTEADNAQKKEETLHALSNGIRNITCAVTRGNKIIEQLLIRLLELNKESRRDVRHLNELQVPLDRLFIEFVTGKPEMESTVFEGLCVNTNHADIGELSHLLENKPLITCLIDFDRMKYSRHIVSQSNSIEDDMQKLVHFKISCVIYRGDNGSIRESCHNKGIMPLKINSHKQLHAISVATGNPVLSSLNELQLKDIKTPVKLSIVGRIHEKSYRGGTSHTLRSIVSVRFLAVTEERYFTILLCGKISALAMLLEERIWSCLHRLNNILNIGKFVCGSGSIERKCVQRLLNFSEKTCPSSPRRSVPRWMEPELHIYRQMVFEEVAKGLQRYCLALSQSIDPSANKGLVIDDVLSKCEAWRRAMRLVEIISRIDIVITKE